MDDKKLNSMNSSKNYDSIKKHYSDKKAKAIVERLVRAAHKENPFKTEWVINYKGYQIKAYNLETSLVTFDNLTNREVEHEFKL